MLTAKTSIAANNYTSGNLLWTNPSGVYCTVKDIEVITYDSSSGVALDLIEVYPTGNPPDIRFCTTGVLMVGRSNQEITNVNVKCSSNKGSVIRARCSGQVEVYCNYIFVDPPFGRFDGYNTWTENGKL